MTRIGNAAYGEEVEKQLNASRIWKNLYNTKGKCALLLLWQRACRVGSVAL